MDRGGRWGDGAKLPKAVVDEGNASAEVGHSRQYVWNTVSLVWDRMTQPGGGGGGASTIADGADVAEGATTDAAVITDANGTVSGKLRGLVKWAFERMPASLGQKTMALSLPVAISSDQSALAAPTLTKGTQGATGYSVQELKDAGRVNIMWTAEFSPAAVAEALLSVTESRDGAAVTTFTTKVVTTGKRLRITGWSMTVENTLGANPKRAKLRARFNTAGAVTTASPLQANLVASVGGTVNTVGTAAMVDFPDGVEFLGDGTKQIGFTLEFPDWVTAAQTGKVYVTITAFEY